MSTQPAPKNLYDVSHLFLSQRESTIDRGRSVEALVWLVNLEREVNRAFLAAGLANAVSAKDIFVTLVEIGTGLPNVGYYYSLGPAAYAGPTADDSRLVGGEKAPRTRFVSASRAVVVESCILSDPPASSVHLLLVSLDLAQGGGIGGFKRSVERLCERLLADHGGPPDAIIACDAGGAPGAAGRIIAEAKREYPGAALFRVTAAAAPDETMGADESIVLPNELKSLWSGRSVPVTPFFDGFASNLLQVLSHRRRKAVRDARG